MERRLELSHKEDQEKVKQEKEELMIKRREKEKEIQRLKRRKAIAQYVSLGGGIGVLQRGVMS